VNSYAELLSITNYFSTFISKPIRQREGERADKWKDSTWDILNEKFSSKILFFKKKYVKGSKLDFV